MLCNNKKKTGQRSPIPERNPRPVLFSLWLPPEFGVDPAGGHSSEHQQDSVVDKDQTHGKKETPEHRLGKVEPILLVHSCQPAAAGSNRKQEVILKKTRQDPELNEHVRNR